MKTVERQRRIASAGHLSRPIVPSECNREFKHVSVQRFEIYHVSIVKRESELFKAAVLE